MKTVENTIARLKSLPASFEVSMYCQFVHMANGGDGSAAHEGEIRKKYGYSHWSDEMFQQVCDAMGWNWKEN